MMLRVQRGSCAAEIDSNRNTSCRQMTPVRQQALERLPGEVAPQSRSAVVDRRAGTADVRMTNARQAAGLLQWDIGPAGRGRVWSKEFERDLSIEYRIPRAVHVAEPPGTDQLEDFEESPREQWRNGTAPWHRRVGGGEARAPEGIAQTFKGLEPVQHSARPGIDLVRRGPVDGAAVGERSGHFEQAGIWLRPFRAG